ncbi:NAD(P)-dependent dehydrogenase, short-chain alcohol dehydrogenase family [Parafrankia irregularis]|uniref:NAD(P)-dependent dehydrogenase, short-chain alcohol dehydrogenase family n=1 Tax=Parafrankia irregularis TaxID=795642 RepID=A0A0S4QVJ5_9ACTN|nr:MULTISPECIES: SDR family oxidoreductase [Parafrankia]CUU59637.1 NAD(P)-dependent dehydrogenase, short-chain alcohol dehydrogenase family [Parafrankia irregularis]
MNSLRLHDKVALITGAARGIGRACAVRYAAEGADLILLDIARDVDDVPYPLGSRRQLAQTADRCRDRGAAALAVPADLRDAASLAKAVAAGLDRFGRIDILVNNAGIAAPSGRPAHEITEHEWAVMLDVDLTGALRMIREVVPAMLERRSGSIINIASTAGLVGYRHFAAYVTAKHGLIGLTKATALDYAPMSVRVNALCPGSVRDDPTLDGRMLAEIARSLDTDVADHEATFVQAQPMNRLIEAEDVAGAAVWLGADDSAQVTGSVVTVDGGFTAR